jgi:hypothetical protein
MTGVVAPLSFNASHYTIDAQERVEGQLLLIVSL